MDKTYYFEMLKKNRLIPFRDEDNRLVCGISFYIGNEEDEERFVRDDMWAVLDDNPKGKVCYIDQLLTDKQEENTRLSYEVFHRFKDYIRSHFGNVEYIRWNRYKNNRVKTYREVVR